MPIAKAYDWLIALTLFSAPVFALTVPHGGTGNYKLLVLLGLLSGWKQLRSLNRFETLVFAGLLGLFLVNLMSFTNTENASQGYNWLGKYLFLFLGLFAYAVVKPRFQFLFRHIDTFLVVNAVSIGLVAAYQVYYLGIPRAQGDAHPILFGDVSVALFGMVLCRILIRRGNWLLFIALLLSLLAAALSATRGALIAVPAIVFVVFLFSGELKSPKVRLILSALVVAIVLASSIKGSPIRDRIEYTLHELQTYSENRNNAVSLTMRFEFWINSIELWKQNPWFGIGPGDYNVEMKRLIESGKVFNTQEHNYRWTPHSNVVNALVSSGILGLIMHLAALYMIPFYAVFRYRNAGEKAIYLYSVLTAYFVFGLSTTWVATHAGFSVFMLFFLFSLSAAISEFGPTGEQESASARTA